MRRAVRTELSPSLVECVASALSAAPGEVVVEALAQGSQASCYDICVRGSDKHFALKVFHPTYRHASPETASAEYLALSKFNEGLKEFSAIGCPAPIALFASEHAYLMTRVNGCHLSDRVDNSPLSNSTQSTVTALLVKALAVFHNASGPYGDFHPDNVLLTEEDGIVRLVLIDPTMANPIYRSAELNAHSPLAVDVGYWTFTEVARHWRMLIRHPRRVGRRFSLARALVESAAASTVVDLRREVMGVVRWHAEQLRAEGGLRLRILATFTVGIATLLCRERPSAKS